MIKIKQSKTADTRTCDVSQVSKEALLESSKQHISDVRKGFGFLIRLMGAVARNHDHTKLSHLDSFYENFKTKFIKHDWWDLHRKAERHHFNEPEFIQEDVNLVDILEQIVDGVMAGMARTGTYRQENIPPELLVKAYNNTVKLLLNEIEIEK